jgi:hypothetical protein
MSLHKNAGGVKGLSWNTERQQWRVRIKVNKETIFIGNFKNKQDAIDALDVAKRKHNV